MSLLLFYYYFCEKTEIDQDSFQEKALNGGFAYSFKRWSMAIMAQSTEADRQAGMVLELEPRAHLSAGRKRGRLDLVWATPRPQ